MVCNVCLLKGKEYCFLDRDEKKLIVQSPDMDDISTGYKYYNIFKWLMRVLSWSFEKQNIYSFHAGAFEFNDKGFLICSEYPAGKSTISLLATKLGGHYINDEYSFVRFKGNVPYIFGTPEMGAHVRIGTRKKMNIKYFPRLSKKYIQHTDTEIFPVEIDDISFNVVKEWGSDRIKHSHKLNFILFLDTSLQNKRCRLEKIDFHTGIRKLMTSSAKHPFGLLNKDNSIFSEKQNKTLNVMLNKELNFNNHIRRQFMERLLSQVVFYRFENNLHFNKISSIIRKLTE